jgi:hypothetical protein
METTGTDDLNPRDRAFRALVEANAVHDESKRRQMVRAAAQTLGVVGVYETNMVIALFNFYNTWIDLNGVAPLSPDGYAASGKRLATHGYAQATPRKSS